MRLLHIKTRRKMPQPDSPLASGRKIKILQVVGSMINGGVEAFLYSYYRELHDYCEFTFVAFDDSTNIPSDMISELGGRVIVVPHVKNLFKFNKAMRNIFKEDYYDIVHSHLNTLSVFPLKIAEEFGVPVRIAHSHTTSNKKEIKRHIAKSILKLYSKSYSNVYFACSELAGRYQFGNAAYDDGEVTIIRNAIDIKKFAFNQEARNEIRYQLNLRDNQFVVGTIGRLVGTKNQKYLFDLAKENIDTQFLIIGTGVLKQELRDQIAALNLNNVSVITPKRGIQDYYSALDTFVLPSFYEGLGLAAIEAEANGLYVICSDRVPQETLLTGYGTYLKTEKKNVSSWNNAINEHHPRVDNANMLIEHGYEIKEASKFLLNKYRQLAKTVKW